MGNGGRITLNLDKAAEFLCIARETARKWALSGRIPSHKSGSNWIFFQDELEIWITKGDKKCPFCEEKRGQRYCRKPE